LGKRKEGFYAPQIMRATPRPTAGHGMERRAAGALNPGFSTLLAPGPPGRVSTQRSHIIARHRTAGREPRLAFETRNCLRSTAYIGGAIRAGPHSDRQIAIPRGQGFFFWKPAARGFNRAPSASSKSLALAAQCTTNIWGPKACRRRSRQGHPQPDIAASIASSGKRLRFACTACGCAPVLFRPCCAVLLSPTEASNCHLRPYNLNVPRLAQCRENAGGAPLRQFAKIVSRFPARHHCVRLNPSSGRGAPHVWSLAPASSALGPALRPCRGCPWAPRLEMPAPSSGSIDRSRRKIQRPGHPGLRW